MLNTRRKPWPSRMYMSLQSCVSLATRSTEQECCRSYLIAAIMHQLSSSFTYAACRTVQADLLNCSVPAVSIISRTTCRPYYHVRSWIEVKRTDSGAHLLPPASGKSLL
jgi:hypothetical protein